MHYLDEGSGDPVVMVHGNPTWSFYYRDLVRALRPSHRCVVPDHIGMGLSDKPTDAVYDYTLRQRIEDFDRLLAHLGIGRDITLVVHDWGGGIGLAWAAENPEKVARLVIFNTGAFPMPRTKSFPWPLWLTRTPLGSLLVRRFNAFSAVASRVCVTRAPLPPEVRRAYVAPYDSYEDRIATLRFVQDIPLRPGDRGYDILARTEEKLPLLADLPALICWGERDFVFDESFLETFARLLPKAEIERFPDCGHYVLEDARAEILPRVERFLREHPLPGRTELSTR